MPRDRRAPLHEARVELPDELLHRILQRVRSGHEPPTFQVDAAAALLFVRVRAQAPVDLLPGDDQVDVLQERVHGEVRAAVDAV
eukprot:31042-Pelagococcus_subviridis.AAC.1